MSWNSKVVWSEGMFLRPQHFQQHDRYLETLVRSRCGPLRPYDWGVTELALDQEALALGKIALARAKGILPDGTPFNLPDDQDPPPPLDIDGETRDIRVLLALPLRRPGMIEVDREDGAETVARYRAVQSEVRDSMAGMDSIAPLEIGQPRLRLILDRGDHSDHACMGVARVVEKNPDGRVILDDKYLPPCLAVKALPGLAGMVTEVYGLLHQRGEALGGRVSASGRGEVAELADFLLLQLINRGEPLFAHLAAMEGLHPEDFYRQALLLAGELATFTRDTKRPPSFPPYVHDDLRKTFAAVMAEIRKALSMVIDPRVVSIPLEERKYGVHVGIITDEIRMLLNSATFILEASADVPNELLRSRFPQQVKVGPVEHIRQLVNLQLPGVALNPLPVAPRQLPYHAGVTYFELDRGSDYWKQLDKSGGFAFHVGGKFPGAKLAFWAIKG